MGRFLARLLVLAAVTLLATPLAAAPDEFGEGWSEEVVAGGVTWLHQDFDDLFGGWQRIDVLVVDPWRADLEFRPAWNGNGGCRAVSTTADSVGAVAAVNAGYFGGPCVHVGELQIAGELLAEQSYEHAAGRTTMGWVPYQGFRFETVAPGGHMLDAWHAIGAGARLVRDGAVAEEALSGFEGFSHGAYRHPRTAVAVTGGGLLLLVTVDGRTGPLGMTFGELGEFLVGLGVADGLNLDGGGSTTMWIDRGDGGEVVNVPSDGGERAVHSILAVVPTDGRPVADTVDGDRALVLGGNTTLDGSASYDPGGDPLTFHWLLKERPDDSDRTITEGSVEQVLFTPDVLGTYLVQLFVHDGTYVSPLHEVTIVAQEETITDDVGDGEPAPSEPGGLCAVASGPMSGALILVFLVPVVLRRRR
jgi:hypothetical protein